MKTLMHAALFTVLCSCGSSGGSTAGGNATVSGTVGGTSVTPQSAGFGTLAGESATNGLTVTFVDVSSETNVCADANVPNTNYKNSKNLALVIYTSGAISAGAYQIGSSMAANVASASFVALDGTCTETQSVAASGSVTITSAGSSSLAGSYTLSFVSQGTTYANDGNLTGTFTAASCAALSASLAAGFSQTQNSNSPTPTCQ